MTVVQVPTAATSVVFRTSVEGRSDLIVVGPRTRGRYHEPKDLPICVRVGLPAGAARRLFGVPVRELVDRVVPLTGLWGSPAAELAEFLASVGSENPGDHDAGSAGSAGSISSTGSGDSAGSTGASGPGSQASARSVAAAMSVVFGPAAGRDEHIHAVRLSPHPPAPGDDPEPGLLRAAMTGLAEPSARLSVVADRVGVGERYLRSLFAQEVGLSPKQYARVSRVRTVLAMAGRHRWAAVAAEAGFFDQAHMIGDFRAVMGVPPAAYLAGKRPVVTPCTSR